MTEIYFFDTYAVLETIFGNKNYEKYISAEILLTKLNLFEIFYYFLKEKDIGKAAFYLDKYAEFAVEFDIEIIKNAGILKRSNPKLSMTDCIGYVISLKEGIKFLTGDREFEKMLNVEFVK